MHSDNPQHLDKTRVRAAFNRAARDYDRFALLQQEVALRLIERLDYVRIEPETIFDLGAGTGHCYWQLRKRYKKARVVALDLAEAMLLQLRRQAGWFKRTNLVCGDIESLPYRDNSVDLIISNLAIQWCNDLDRSFAECRRVLKPGGLLMFTTFGPDTLKELRQSWAQVDDGVHVNQFIDMHDIGDALLRAGLAGPVMDAEAFTLTYPDVTALMRDLKAIGAHNVHSARRRGLTGRQRLLALRDAYEDYRTPDGVLPAHYELLYGHAWAPDEKSTASVSGESYLSIDSLTVK